MEDISNVVTIDEIEEKFAKSFTGSEIIHLTSEFDRKLGLEAPLSSVGYRSKKDALYINLSVLNEDQRIQFFSQMRHHSKVKDSQELCSAIDSLIGPRQGSKESRSRLSERLNAIAPEIALEWENTCKFYDNNNYREALDGVRLSLELLVKNLTSSNASLENQQKYLGRWLNEKGTDSQFRNLFFKMLDMYCKIQNNNAKHSLPTGLSQKEISFLLNQASMMMNFLLDCAEENC